MGAFGSTIGGIMAIASLFLGAWVTFTFTDNMLSLLWFTIFGIIGGLALGGLNSRKARSQAKYKNEYTSYAGMSFAAIVFLGIYFAFLGKGTLEDRAGDNDAMTVLGMAVLSGILALLGFGLTVANSIAEK